MKNRFYRYYIPQQLRHCVQQIGIVYLQKIILIQNLEYVTGQLHLKEHY